MRISNIRLGISSLTASGTDILLIVNIRRNYQKDSSVQNDSPDTIRLTAMACRGDTFEVKIPYEAKLEEQYRELYNAIENFGGVKVKLKEPKIKIYAFVDDKSRLVSGVSVTASGYSMEDEVI